MHVIGTVNFAFDRSKTPHISATDISDYFGVGKSSPATKSKKIRDLLDIGLMDPKWTLPSRMDSNPMAWHIMVDGLILDARSLSRHIIQQMQGPILHAGSPQSKLAPGLLQLVTEVLQDKAYLARLQRHYALFKQALNDPILSTFAQRYKRLRSKPRRRKHR